MIKRNKFNRNKLYYFKYIIIILNNIIILNIYFFQKNYLSEDIIMKYLSPVKISKLIDLPNNRSASIIKNEKIELLKYISRCTKRNITKIKRIFLNLTLRFGNQIILLNKVIFFAKY